VNRAWQFWGSDARWLCWSSPLAWHDVGRQGSHSKVPERGETRQLCRQLPDSDDSDDETVNPLSSVPVVVQQASQYEGKFGAPKGLAAVSVVVLPGRGLMTDKVSVVDHAGNTKVRTSHLSEAASRRCARCN
jgi:hypothetical protein